MRNARGRLQSGDRPPLPPQELKMAHFFNLRLPHLTTHAGRAFSILFGDTRRRSQGEERYRRILLSTFADIFSKCVNIGTNLAIVPIALKYLGTENFGLWMTLTSAATFLTFSDLGMGIGLQNKLAELNGKDDRKNPRQYVSSAIFLMSVMCILFSAFALLAAPYLPLNSLFKIEDPATRANLLPTFQVIMITFGFGLVCNLTQRMYNGYQEGYWFNLWLSLGKLLGFAGALFCIWKKLPLAWLAAVSMGVPFLMEMVSCIHLFKRHPYLIPSLGAVTWQAIKPVTSIGISAVGAQVAFTLLGSGIPILIANRYGVSSVSIYSITMRLVSIVVLFLSTALTPLWPAYGEAAARNDWEWIQKTYRRSMALGFLAYLPCFFIILFAGRWIIKIWTGDAAVLPSISLLMACDLWGFLYVWNLVVSMFLNGMNRMVGQALYGNATALGALALGALLAPVIPLDSNLWIMVGAGMLVRMIFMESEARACLQKLRPAF